MASKDWQQNGIKEPVQLASKELRYSKSNIDSWLVGVIEWRICLYSRQFLSLIILFIL